MSDERQAIESALDQGEGVLRLLPNWVPRAFCIPGKRLKLHPDDCYAYGAHRGGIDERWFASTTPADNGPATTPDEGLSWVATPGSAVSRVKLRDAVELCGDALLGPEVMRELG